MSFRQLLSPFLKTFCTSDTGPETATKATNVDNETKNEASKENELIELEQSRSKEHYKNLNPASKSDSKSKSNSVSLGSIMIS